MSVGRFTAIVAFGIASVGAGTAADAQSFNAEPVRAGVYIFNATKHIASRSLAPSTIFAPILKGIASATT